MTGLGLIIAAWLLGSHVEHGLNNIAKALQDVARALLGKEDD